jgi:hypothetical protein
MQQMTRSAAAKEPVAPIEELDRLLLLRGAREVDLNNSPLAAIPDVTPVPYRGAGPLTSDLISGHVPIGIVGVTAQSLGFHRAGNIRILAVPDILNEYRAQEGPDLVCPETR